ncbi:hypothetical protein OS493_015315, partial [Desmophyllum pertusum]
MPLSPVVSMYMAMISGSSPSRLNRVWRLVYVRDCPAEVPDSAVSGFFGSFGEVHSISPSEHDGFPGLRDGTRVVKMTLTKDVPPVARVAGFDCRVRYRRQPACCTIYKKSGHRGKGCPLNGLCRRCEKPGHVAKECRNAWASRSTSVRRPAAPAAPASAAASDAAAAPPAAPDHSCLLLLCLAVLEGS